MQDLIEMITNFPSFFRATLQFIHEVLVRRRRTMSRRTLTVQTRPVLVAQHGDTPSSHLTGGAMAGTRTVHITTMVMILVFSQACQETAFSRPMTCHFTQVPCIIRITSIQ